MERTTITAASAQFGVSPRTLRYWEQIGLIESQRQPDYAYRTYTPETVQRIGQILILRRLRIPLAEVAAVLSDPTARTLLEVLQTNIARIDAETDALAAVRHALNALANRAALMLNLRPSIPAEDGLSTLLAQVTPPSVKEDIKMNDLSKAENVLNQRLEVRYIYLPPMTIAASQYIGPNPEDNASAALDRFVQESGLLAQMPGLRVFGFNNPQPETPGAMYGYEYWVTIPEDFHVPAPLVKKFFPGGLYAAHAIRIGDFHEWGPFMERMQADPDYDINWREPYSMGGCLEEHLNAPTYYGSDCRKNYTQIDLMIPIVERSH